MTDSPHQPTPNIRPEWSRGLREWAEANDAVGQLWVFGSRARGDEREGKRVASAPPAFDAFQVERNLQRHNNIHCVPTARCFG
jgi:hypothetical protein